MSLVLSEKVNLRCSAKFHRPWKIIDPKYVLDILQLIFVYFTISNTVLQDTYLTSVLDRPIPCFELIFVFSFCAV